MNIAFLLRYWPDFGGGEAAARTLANEFAARRNNVYIIYFWENNKEHESFIDDRVRQIYIDDLSVPDKKHNIGKADFKKLKFAFKNIMQTNDINIIINLWWPPKLVFRTKQRNIKQINCYHTNIFQKYGNISFKHRLFNLFFRNYSEALLLKIMLYNHIKYCDRWVLLCNSFIEEVKLLFSSITINEKVCAIPNPLKYSYTVSRDEIKNKEKKILYVGRIDENKRIHYLIDAWSELEPKEEYFDWNLVIIGDGISLTDIKEYARSKQCQKIIFEGQQEPSKYYLKSMIFVMTSANEGWPMVLGEAQQHGCVPIVMDSFVSLHEIINNGKDGIIIKNNDVIALKNAMEMLMNNEEYRTNLAINGLDNCKNFSIESIIIRWEKLFSELYT